MQIVINTIHDRAKAMHEIATIPLGSVAIVTVVPVRQNEHVHPLFAAALQMWGMK